MNPLTSVVERERRLAEERALEASREELARDLEKLEAAAESYRAAARQREQDIRETVARTGRNVRSGLAAEVYAELGPLVRDVIAEHTRTTVRALASAWTGFKARCLAETGRPLGARPIVNIMIAELAGSAASLVHARGFSMLTGYSLLANLEGGLEAALSDGFNHGAVERAFDAVEAEIQRIASGVASHAAGPKQEAQWATQRTALSSTDAALLAATSDPPPEPPTPPASPAPTLDGSDGYKPSFLQLAAARARSSGMSPFDGGM
jgi:hypothetical protein